MLFRSELKSVASKSGIGIGIIHPGPVVIGLIENLVKEALFEGYKFVTLSDVASGS